jgi:hypothetical protein
MRPPALWRSRLVAVGHSYPIVQRPPAVLKRVADTGRTPPRAHDRGSPGAEIAVSLVEIPPDGLRRRGLVAGHMQLTIGRRLEKRSIRDGDAHPGLCLIASTDEVIVG